MAGEVFVETRILQQKLTSSGVLFPAVVSPPGPEVASGLDLEHFLMAVTAHKPRLESLLLSSGAVLLRGFPVQTASDFDRVVAAFGYDELHYSGVAPRTRVVGRVFTANESPPEHKIHFHHELSNVLESPSKLFFFCEEEPRSGGETPIVLSNPVYERMKQRFPEFVEKLEKKGLIYIQVLEEKDNLSSPIGRGWQSTFSTKEKSAAEERAAQLGMSLEWMEEGVKTKMGPLPAIRLDEARGQKVWFNGMAFFGSAGKDESLKGITFGDGSSLPDDVIDEYIKILEEECVAIPWKKGDIFMLDNFAVLHGRRPSASSRRILASLCK